MISGTAVEKAWLLQAGSVRGKGHIDAGLPNQDAVAVCTSPDGAIVAAVVSDGAGTAVKSEHGARTTADFMADCLLRIGVDIRKGRLQKTQVGERLVEGISCLRDKLNENGGPLRDYHCTLVGCLILPHGGFVCQIGDSIGIASRFSPVRGGAAEMVDYFPDEHCWWYEVERGEYANETHFVTETDWRQHFRVKPLPKEFDAVVLMTDGAMDVATLNGKVFRGFLSNLVAQILQMNSSAKRAHTIETWLADPQTFVVTGDDKTIFMAIRSDCRALAALSPISEAHPAECLPDRLDAAATQPLAAKPAARTDQKALAATPTARLTRFTPRDSPVIFLSLAAGAAMTLAGSMWLLKHERPEVATTSQSKADVHATAVRPKVTPMVQRATVVAHPVSQDPPRAASVRSPVDEKHQIDSGDKINVQVVLAPQGLSGKGGLSLSVDERSCYQSDKATVTCNLGIIAEHDATAEKAILCIKLTDGTGGPLPPLRVELQMTRKPATAMPESREHAAAAAAAAGRRRVLTRLPSSQTGRPDQPLEG